MILRTLVITILITFVFSNAAAKADLVAVLNPSFEFPAVADGSFTNSIENWLVGGPAGVFNPVAGTTYTGPGTTDGQQTAFGNQGASIAQVLTANLTANTDYTLQVDLGDRLDTEFASYTVGLYAGGNLLAEDASSLTPNDGFLTSTVSYLALPGDPNLGQALEIRLGVGTSGQQVNFDNVRLNAMAIPEPSSVALLATATLGLLFLRRWKPTRRKNGHPPAQQL